MITFMVHISNNGSPILEALLRQKINLRKENIMTEETNQTTTDQPAAKVCILRGGTRTCMALLLKM